MPPYRALSEPLGSFLVFLNLVVSQRRWALWLCFTRTKPRTQCSKFIPICQSSHAPADRNTGQHTDEVETESSDMDLCSAGIWGSYWTWLFLEEHIDREMTSILFLLQQQTWHLLASSVLVTGKESKCSCFDCVQHLRNISLWSENVLLQTNKTSSQRVHAHVVLRH